MGFVAAMAAAGVATKIAGSLSGAAAANAAAADEVRAAETSKILEAAFFDDEVGGIIAESARLVGAAEAEAGARGVKSTTGSAATRVGEIRMAAQREINTAAQESVLARHGFDQAATRAGRRTQTAKVQGGLAVAGFAFQGASSIVSERSRRSGRTNNQVGRL